jgi:hypothetical protein
MHVGILSIIPLDDQRCQLHARPRALTELNDVEREKEDVRYGVCTKSATTTDRISKPSFGVVSLEIPAFPAHCQHVESPRLTGRFPE